MTKGPTPHIGVFDSGFGGLTVLRALLPRIPGAHYTYLGDTARLPYGAKSQATIARYAVESARFLEDHGAELLVIACNTATALALPEITAAVSVPVIGVIEPVVQMAHLGRENSEVLVLATAATVQSHAYLHACERRGLHATEYPCPLLVPLVEEGWTNHPVTRDVLRIYIAEALRHAEAPRLVEAPHLIGVPDLIAAQPDGTPRRDSGPSAVILGCTHYPLLAGPIERTLRELGSQAAVIDSAHATAEATAKYLGVTTHPKADSGATFECFATDSVEKFQRLGSQFLQRPLAAVQLLDLGG